MWSRCYGYVMYVKTYKYIVRSVYSWNTLIRDDVNKITNLASTD